MFPIICRIDQMKIAPELLGAIIFAMDPRLLAEDLVHAGTAGSAFPF